MKRVRARGSATVPAEAGARRLARARVAVLLGGRSGEREVSVASGRAIVEALAARADGRGPARVTPDEIGADGAWRLSGRDPRPAAAALAKLADRIDLAFLALHGGEGENGVLQGMLQACGVAYTGSGPAASGLAMDKHLARRLAATEGLACAPGRLVDARSARALARGDEPELARWLDAGGRRVVKPRRSGSSVGVRIVAGGAAVREAVEVVLAGGDDALVEEEVLGVELACGVLGNRGGDLRALEPIEIRPATGRFFDYEQKYAPSGAVELCPAPSLDAAAREAVRESAAAAHRVLGCDGVSRSDFVLPRLADGGLGAPVFLETNTLPGMTPRSLVPKEAAREGLAFRDLCLAIAALGLEADRRHA